MKQGQEMFPGWSSTGLSSLKICPTSAGKGSSSILPCLPFPLSACVCAGGGNHQECEELRIQALKINSKQREEKMQKDGELLRAKMELETLRKKTPPKTLQKSTEIFHLQEIPGGCGEGLTGEFGHK